MSSLPKPTTNQVQPYTYEDYLTWTGPEQWELIDGVPYMMASPTPEHQEILLNLASLFHAYLQEKTCTPFIAPLDLTFEDDDRTRTVVQPDMFVMCGDYSHNQRIIGVPVLVVEILSNSTATNDTIRKLNLYQRMQVQEYWIIDPVEQRIHVYLHDGTVLRWIAEYKPGDTLSPSMFTDMVINTSRIFPFHAT